MNCRFSTIEWVATYPRKGVTETGLQKRERGFDLSEGGEVELRHAKRRVRRKNKVAAKPIVQLMLGSCH